MDELYGSLPEPNFSDNALTILNRRYLHRDDAGKVTENPKDMLYRVARTVAAVDLNYGVTQPEVDETTKNFYGLMARNLFLPNSPTLRGAGIDSNLAACFVLPVYDSRKSIFKTLQDAVEIQAFGGGTGFSFSELRPDGSIISSTKGTSRGPLPFIDIYDKVIGEVIAQGGVRQGANMGILNYNHPDIMKFIRYKSSLNEKNKRVVNEYVAESGLDLESDEVKTLEKILVRNLQLSNFNLSVGITEDFMRMAQEGKEYELINHKGNAVGKLNAKQVLDEIVKGAWRTGDPGVIYLDRIERDNPTPALGKIISTNPCVVGSTLVSTEFGLIRMKELVKNHGEGGIGIVTDSRIPIKVQNMDGTIMFIEQNQDMVGLRVVSCAFFSGIKPVYKLLTKSGYELEVTSDHKIFTTKGKKKLIELVPGKDKVLIQDHEGVFNKKSEITLSAPNVYIGSNGRVYTLNLPKKWSKELGQILGLLVGDGWLRDNDKNRRVGFTFSKSDKEVLDYIKPLINGLYGKEIKEVKRKNGVFHLSYHSKYFVDFFKKLGVLPVYAQEKKVPEMLFGANKEAVIGFLQGLFTADGTLRDSKKSSSDWIALTSKSIGLLKQVQVLLINLGIKSRIFNRSRKSRDKLFKYRNVKGKTKYYSSDGILYELGIFGGNIEKFKEKIGFLNKSKQDKLNDFRSKERRAIPFSDLVVDIIYCGEKEVYDLTEPATHSMICNGIVTTQCGEQPLLPYEACNLGSINLAKMLNGDGIDYTRLEKTARAAVRFLDNVIDANAYVVPEIEEMTKGNRKIGLGVMGFADMLVQLGIPYNSQQGLDVAEKVMQFINDRAQEASHELADLKGSFPNLDKSIFTRPIRNATRTTIAPTGTISTLFDASSGIEPYFALYYVRGSIFDAEGRPTEHLAIANPYLDKFLRDKGIDPRPVVEYIKKAGTILGAPKVPKEIQELFLTSNEVPVEQHLRMQSAFQNHIDNAVSKTINLKSDATIEDIANAYWLSYTLGNVKGLTVYRDGSKGAQVLTTIRDDSKKTFEDVLAGNPVRGRHDKDKKWFFGATVEQKTGCGKLFCTVNQDQHGPIEIFNNMNPAGGCSSAQLASSGINVSLGLQSNVDPKSYIKHNRAIKCPQRNELVGMLSCSEAYSQALDDFMGIMELLPPNFVKRFDDAVEKYFAMKEKNGNGKAPVALDNRDGMNRVDAVCPTCRSPLFYGEGCKGGKCMAPGCGFSSC
ncbi:MAG: LAGLIDADG family homing endonuclease [archaeon]